MSHTFSLRVYIEDTDAGGIVYHARYLNFLERGRTEWLRTLGFEQQSLMGSQVQLVVRSLSCRFIRPARLDDALEVTTTVKGLSACAVTFDQQIDRKGEHLFSAEVDIACIDTERLRPTRWPGVLETALKNDLLTQP
ncbi:tol-pal system-associated acyl-CoA thioesterase [Larsenimonas rhizosphaerae]|uniref:Tol-pal system-associated acyl-CoA thioesterase n=1 Tax=Larsenimonas rhizosphaerae TaxID=2944682 RepID=A0AA41ZF30_9GAMM|nr:tol-pal system-associated acyl-CoA thioesterase [Larsenimonas rhizosphaerae]MCX2523375.1 tol-pal system-associated acyl-CoA thioesterase [Larsenimonas rhizosphaerae]